MDFKEKLHKYMQKFKEIWSTGKIQRSSRITYDVTWNVILFFLVVGFIGTLFVGGLGAGYFASLVQDQPIRSHAEMQEDIYNYSETSSLYFAGEEYFGDVRSDLYREETSLENVSDTLINAVIATEDEYFEVHEGIVPKAIFRALVQEVTNAPIQTGGSTLTQQLVKNQILTNEVSFERKAKEMLIALRLERFFEKDEILEAYLNIVPYGRDASGRNIAGIQTAAQGIFGIDASEVNLPQAAYLAGLPQSPSAYTPFANSGGLKEEEGLQPGLNRMEQVLERMLDSEYITQEEYDQAMNYDIVSDFTEDFESPIETYPHLTYELQDRATEILMEIIAEEDGYTMEDLEADEELYAEYWTLAERDLRNKGYQIHSTINKEIYDRMRDVTQNYENYLPDWTGSIERPNGEIVERMQAQTGSILIENSSGRIISFVGGRNFNEGDQVNYVTSPRSPGSTIKPLLVYAPAMEEGVAQPGTPIADVDLPIGNYDELNNYSGRFYGLVPARTALKYSYNNSTVRLYNKIIDGNPAKNYLERMGITTLRDEEHAYLSLGIGATHRGVTVEENTNAFSTLGNNGKFADAYMVAKITNNDGEVIYEHEAETNDVFSPQTNYLTIDMMRDVMTEGTGTYAASRLAHSGVDWAGKSGTSENWEDVWFVGTNPNVTLGTWMGYEIQESLYVESSPQWHSQSVQGMWAELVNAATDLNPELMAPQENFERPDGIVERSYCAISGKLPSDLCAEAGLIQSDLFNAEFVPTEEDDSLVRGGSYVTVNGRSVMAGPNTPGEFIQGDGLTFSPEFIEENGFGALGSITELYPSTNRAAWEQIGAPSGSSSGSVENDGSAPSAPGGVSSSGGTLNWSASGSNDVVGYRIYRASSPGGSFSQVGSTTSTSYSIGGDGVYHVRAVDYFGMESGASNEAVVGSPSSGGGGDNSDSGSDGDSGDGDGDGGNSNDEGEDSGSDSESGGDSEGTGGDDSSGSEGDANNGSDGGSNGEGGSSGSSGDGNGSDGDGSNSNGEAGEDGDENTESDDQ
ncbi:transglycosylase domain-containing protein [Lentibacillus sediminis]|uniref:transglycosylase domain-containing protein n=1 Tax=Lentibacillus sediminis TaxID=1940529 RepID=UPI000C1C10EA|nr:transglycosylase domain-containing protein [Lentibacillus sediminis]